MFLSKFYTSLIWKFFTKIIGFSYIKLLKFFLIFFNIKKSDDEDQKTYYNKLRFSKKQILYKDDLYGRHQTDR